VSQRERVSITQLIVKAKVLLSNRDDFWRFPLS